MSSTVPIEEAILEGVKTLPSDKKQEVLDFVEFLLQKFLLSTSKAQPSLRQIVGLPLEARHRLLAQTAEAMAEDFKSDPTLAEFSSLDDEDWDLENG
jgi:hypothetical protein